MDHSAIRNVWRRTCWKNLPEKLAASLDNFLTEYRRRNVKLVWPSQLDIPDPTPGLSSLARGFVRWRIC